MSIKQLLYFCFSLCTLCAYGQNKSKIKTIKEISFKISFTDSKEMRKDTISGMLGTYSISTFDNKGKKTNITSYDNNNNIFFKININYLDNGKVKSTIVYNSNNTVRSQDELIYNDKKLVQIKNIRSSGTINYYEKYNYDKNDSLITIEKFQSDNILISTEYIKNNKTIEKVEYGMYGALGLVYKSSYNDENLAQEEKFRILENNSQELLETKTFHYDEKNRLIEIKSTSPIFSSETTKFQYNEKNDWIEKWNYYKDDITLTERIIEYYE